MEFTNTYKNLIRFYSNPNSLCRIISLTQYLSSSTSPKTLISTINPSSSSSIATHQDIHYKYFVCSSCFRPFSTSSSGSFSSKSSVSREKFDLEKSSRGTGTGSYNFSRNSSKHKVGNHSKPKVNPGQVREIVEVIKRDEDDMELKLNGLGISLSLDLIGVIFRHLNSDRVSGLRFFLWVRESKVGFSRNSEFCSLVIDNLGRIREYGLMIIVLKEFSKEKLCLTEKAFGFVTIGGSLCPIVRSYVEIVVKMLREVGGSCFSSGIHALIKKLCISNYFDLAKFVMEEVGRKTSYYNVLIWAKCGGISVQEARDLFDEMRRFGCEPDANSYNYLLGSFFKNEKIADACKILEIMEEFGFPLNATTFEMFIHHSCSLGRLDSAVEFLNQMSSRGIEPRLTTHAALIKEYFYGNRFQEAYKYVVDMGDKYKCSANENYSLLATLLQRSGRVIEAREILVDMMEKGLKPNFPVYMKVLKDLYKSGKGDLVADLKSRFSKYS